MRLIIEPDYERMSKWAANYVAKCINEANPTAHSVTVLKSQSTTCGLSVACSSIPMPSSFAMKLQQMS